MELWCFHFVLLVSPPEDGLHGPNFLHMVCSHRHCIAIASPYVFAQIHDTHGGRLVCGVKWKEVVFGESSSAKNYYLPRHLLLVYIPIFLLIILYSVILIKLKSQNIPGNQSITNAEKQHRIRNRNVLKMALATVVGFILCWLRP